MKRITTISLIIISLLILSDRMFFKAKAETTASAQKSGQSPDRELLEQRYKAAAEILNAERMASRIGGSTIKRICRAARRAHKAEIALHSDQEKLISLHTKYVTLLRDMEKRAEAHRSAGLLHQRDVTLFRYWRLTGEIELLRVKRILQASRASHRKRMTRIEEALGRLRVLHLWA
jgi:hypothetical protein